MSGLVPMAEYRRLVERCERLEDELAYYRSDDVEAGRAMRRNALRRTIGLGGHGAPLLCALIESPRGVHYGTLYNLDRSQVVIVCRLRRALREAGCPVNAIESLRGIGHRLTTEGRAWLQQTCPDAFPKPKEAAR